MSRFTLFLAALLLAGGIAEAHALLLTTTVQGQDVVLHFNGRIDAARSRLSLVDKDGSVLRQLDSGAGDDAATLTGRLGGVAPGSYVVRWEVLSVDGHISRGDQPVTIPAP